MAYAPVDEAPVFPEQVELPAAPSLPSTGVRSTGKSARPPLPDEAAEDEIAPVAPVDPDTADPHAADFEALDAPPPARASLADVRYGSDALPGPVASTRDALIEAARSGDIEALRPIFAAQSVPPIVAAFAAVEDPVAHLKLQSGDAAGREILAILLELLESGHVHVGSQPSGTYVWPYFAEVPLSELTAKHYVELYRLLTAIDVEELERQGRYTFFRVGIAADGRIRYFAAGDLE